MPISHDDFENNLTEIIDYSADWDVESREDYRFFSLQQWDQDDAEALAEEGRPALVFDRTRPIIQTLMGSQITSRFQAQYLPVQSDISSMDAQISEPLSAVAKWVQAAGDFEQHESLAFQDTLVTGVGCIEIYASYEINPDGLILARRVPSREIGWDPTSVEPNNLDARFVIRDRMIDEDELASLFGKAAVQDVLDLASRGTEARPNLHAHQGATVRTNEQRYAYDLTRPAALNDRFYDPISSRVRLYEQQSWSRYYQTRIIGVDVENAEAVMQAHQMAEELGIEPEYPQMEIFEDSGDPTEKTLQDLQLRTEALNLQIAGRELGPIGPPATIPDFPVRVYLRSWHTAAEKLKEEPIPFPAFSYLFITAYEDWSDRNGRRHFFGPMRAMRDPQKYSNKFMSQAIHLFTGNPKGALLYEEDFFTDQSKAAKDWNRATGMIKVKKGTLRHQNEKFRQLNTNVNLRGIETLLANAQSAVGAAAGVSEAYGVGTVGDLRRTSGSALSSVLSSQQKTNATPFDSLRLYRKNMGRLILYMLDAYIDPAQVIRVVGKENEQIIEVINEGRLAEEYDIRVEEIPTSPNERQEVFEVLMQSGILPQLMQQGVPIPPDLADFFPIPNDASQQLKATLQQHYDMARLNAEIQILTLTGQLQQMQAAAQQGIPPNVAQEMQATNGAPAGEEG